MVMVCRVSARRLLPTWLRSKEKALGPPSCSGPRAGTGGPRGGKGLCRAEQDELPL
jgi:hypothetical protein